MRLRSFLRRGSFEIFPTEDGRSGTASVWCGTFYIFFKIAETSPFPVSLPPAPRGVSWTMRSRSGTANVVLQWHARIFLCGKKWGVLIGSVGSDSPENFGGTGRLQVLDLLQRREKVQSCLLIDSSMSL